MIEIAESAWISELAEIEDSVKGSRIVIGPRVRIDSFVKLKAAGGTGDVIIEEGTYINSGTVIYIGNGVHIGRGVLIAANCTLAPTSHEFRRRDVSIKEQGFKASRGGIRIEDDVWIGCNTVILDGAFIKRGAVIGAAALVNGPVESYSVCVGNPLRQVGTRT